MNDEEKKKLDNLFLDYPDDPGTEFIPTDADWEEYWRRHEEMGYGYDEDIEDIKEREKQLQEYENAHWEEYWQSDDYIAWSELVDRISAGLQKSITVNAPTVKIPSVKVPSVLWKGKPYASVRNAMRPKEEGGEGFLDAIIAYVLFNWCGLKNKTALGRLLGEPNKDTSSYRRLATRLLKEAASLTITPD